MTECLLCAMWNRMPYAKRYSTPVAAAEAEGILVVGYWVATRKTDGLVVRMCERHMAVVTALDGQEEARKAREEAAKAQSSQSQLPPQFQESLAGFQQRKEQLIANMQSGAAPEPPKPSQEPPFVLGPGPLNNGNVVTAPPPMPVPLPAPLPMPTTQPVLLTGQPMPMALPVPLTGQPFINTTGQTVQPTEPLKNPDLPQAHVQGAALIDAPCLFCKVMVKTGEVHNCPQAMGRGN
jgi:hypothetical protein